MSMLRFFSRYLAELLAERHKLGPFIPVIPHSVRLLNQGQISCHHALSTAVHSKLDALPLLPRIQNILS
jgi:hypothetical protein